MASLSPPDRSATLLTEREVAGVLRVSGRTVRRWACTGTLHAIEIGGVRRYRAADIAALINPENDARPPGKATSVTTSAVQATDDEA